MEIAWSNFSWEAFATLATGLAAVTGAIYLGRRQLEISRRQAEVLAHQLRLEELGLRHALFDRRIEVYVGIRDLLVDIMTNAKPPTGDVALKYHQAVGSARFLFDEPVNEKIEELRQKFIEYRSLHIQMKAVTAKGGPWENDEPHREGELLMWFIDRLGTLPDIFGDAIKLA